MDRRASIITRALVMITTAAVGVLLLLSTAGQATGRVTPTVTYRVHPGDTLWRVAREHASDDVDVRDVVETIRRLNQLDGSILQIGQELQVPAGTTDGSRS